MPSAPESTSNWDFTPVLNLLRSPTCQSGDGSALDKRPGYRDHPCLSHSLEKHNVHGHSVKDEKISSPKLGDFGSLWELLGSTSPSPAPKGKGCHHEPRKPSEQPSHAAKPAVILKRSSSPDSTAGKTLSILKRPAQPVPVINVVDTQSSRDQNGDSKFSKFRRRRGKTGYDSSSSENDTAGELDSLFDPPLSKPQSIRPMIPPQVGAVEANTGALETPPSSFDESDAFLAPAMIERQPSAGTRRLQPLAYKTAADQQVGLLTKLLKKFPGYAEQLVESGRSKKSKETGIESRPIHVFVDMSNIMVGFHDTIKVSRNIPVKTRIPRVPLSFQNFSLILERGRPAAKRVLVGSDRFAAISKGEKLGYEANILDRVQKVKQLTPRQLKFRRSPKAAAQDGGTGSETNDAPEERWVEQGVDEILHLKILESLLDAEPATIVLATGDAAEAEYSGGFMKMVERALQRGWRVELVSFSQVTSYAYHKKEFRSRWGDRFQVITLDDFIEELIDT
ncbi:hypothetical protein BJX61DRAFT_543061 [Aspergillus egyptiacus]|nr:hypothetical protein BJX61DRAFT_543061 [Aspergillus egyptiacus]